MSKGGGGKKTEIKFKSLFSNTIHEVLSRRPGWKETDKDDWDFIWADKDWIRLHFDEFRNSFTSTTRVNHFRNHYELTRKDHMVKNLKRMVSNLRREEKAAEAANYDFFPVTYLLPMEYGVFVEDFKRQTDKPIWIAKPTGKAQGKGIFLFTDLKDVKLWKKAAENRGKPQQVSSPPYAAAGVWGSLRAADRRTTRTSKITSSSATSRTPIWQARPIAPRARPPALTPAPGAGGREEVRPPHLRAGHLLPAPHRVALPLRLRALLRLPVPRPAHAFRMIYSMIYLSPGPEGRSCAFRAETGSQVFPATARSDSGSSRAPTSYRFSHQG